MSKERETYQLTKEQIGLLDSEDHVFIFYPAMTLGCFVMDKGVLANCSSGQYEDTVPAVIKKGYKVTCYIETYNRVLSRQKSIKPNVMVVVMRANMEVEENKDIDLTGFNTNEEIIREVLNRVNQCNCYSIEQHNLDELMTVWSIHKDGETIYIIDYNP